MRTNTLTTLSDPERLRYSLQSMLEHVTGPLRDRLKARLVEVERQLRQRKGTQRAYQSQSSREPARKNPHRVGKDNSVGRDTTGDSGQRSRWERAFPGQAEAAKGVQRRHTGAVASPSHGARSTSPEGLRSHRRPAQPVQPRRSAERSDRGDQQRPATPYRELLACKRCQWATESETRYACPKGHILECHQARPSGEGWEVK